MKSKIILAAHQPNFMPNLGYFYKMSNVDVFVVITNIQFEKHEGWQQRNKIIGPNGDQWLIVPVLGSQNQKIKEVKIDYSRNWLSKHVKTLLCLYSKSSEKEFLSKLIEIYQLKYERLADLNIELIKLIHKTLEISTQLIIDEEVSGLKHDLLINICKKYDASLYLSGLGAKKYMTSEYFIELEKEELTNNFIETHHLYNFPHSIVHYILKEGKEKVRSLLYAHKELLEIQ